MPAQFFLSSLFNTARLFAGIGLLCLLSSAVNAQEVYKTVDENGKVIFSDKPQDEDSVEVDVELKNVQPPVNFRAPVKASNDDKPAARDYTLYMQTPAQETQIGPAQKSLTMSVSVSPRLLRQHSVQFYFDGTPIGAASKSLSASMPLGLKQRGRRQVSAAVLDEDGQVVSRSDAHTIYVIRP